MFNLIARRSVTVFWLVQFTGYGMSSNGLNSWRFFFRFEIKSAIETIQPLDDIMIFIYEFFSYFIRISYFLRKSDLIVAAAAVAVARNN